MKRLAGKQALVTGGRQGIGRAIVDRFDQEGASVTTCGRGERPDDLPANISWVRCDVSDRNDVESLVAAARASSGALDIVVNNAGIQIEKTIVDTTDADWESLVGVNVRGVFLVCRAAIPHMSNGASIINIGSTSASIADAGLAIYNASKAFVEGLTRSIAVDHGPAIRCNAISPGWIMTDMAAAAFSQASNPEAAERSALSCHPAGRMGKPEDIAALACWLGSSESVFATGQCYKLDGGLSAASPMNTVVTDGK